MAFDFPAAPVLDQTYTAHGVTFRWNSYAWVQVGAVYAPVASPVFTGDPQAPTPATADNDNSLATTAFVKAQSYITASALTPYAPLASPALSGNPTAPTPAAADNDTSIATTAFVQGELTAKAPLASPTFTGDPKAPTPLTADNDTSIATTAFVKAQGYVTGGPYQPLDADLTALAALAGTNVIYYRSAADTWAAVTVSTGLSFSGGALSCTVSTAGLAPLASPALTGNPTAPTPAAADNDTSIATTAFVQGELTGKVSKTGDTMSGNLAISKTSGEASYTLNSPVAGGQNTFYGSKGGALRWAAIFGAGNAESGGDIGSEFLLLRYNDAGGYVGPPVLAGYRTDGLLQVAGDPVAVLGIATKQYTDGKVAKTGDTMSGMLTLPKITIGVTPGTGTEPANVLSKTASTGSANASAPQHVQLNCIAGNNDWGNVFQSYWYDSDGSVGLGIGLRQGGVNYEMFRLRRGAATGWPAGSIDMTVPLLAAGDPTYGTEVATKQYVDARKAVAHVASSAPAGAEDGALWYENDSGLLYIRYNDGSSTQWVAIAARAEATP